MRGDTVTIGLIIPDSGTAVLDEYRKLLPPGVEAVAVSLPLRGGEMTTAALAEMSTDGTIERAALALRLRRVDCALFACTAGSLLHGREWDAAITSRISRVAGVPALTTATAALWALRAVGSQRLTMITPYLPELDIAEKAYLEEVGYDVVSVGGAEHRFDAEISLLTPDDLAWHVDLVDLGESDTVFVSCNSWRVLDALSRLEAVHRRKFVTSNQAGAWATVRLLGIPDPVTGFGALPRSTQLPGSAYRPSTDLALPVPHIPWQARGSLLAL